MNPNTAVWLFLSVQAVGIALWLTLAALNNLRDFAGSAAAVGATMAMQPLAQEPRIPTPLFSRALRSASLHRGALAALLLLQALGAALGWIGCHALLIQGDLAAARPWLNGALAFMSAALLAMHLSGLWFGYWIRQETLQLTHIALLLWTGVAFLLFNLIP
ncbi:DUF2165 family protein [Achromobacter sp. NPDC058515]|uniref:DUF2165 family protein n=1 Tax=Achromobacter sp. NPDC058515 TaxID=3346533 RepID=UPI0036563EEE